MTSAGPDSARTAEILRRLETAPVTRVHGRALATVGTAHLFDAFDALTIAFVLPILIKLWSLSPAQAGLLIAVGYMGQAVGAVLFGWMAERIGRRRALQWTVFLLSGASLCCAFAPTYAALLALRAVQGVGLGGEGPVAATYLNELSPISARGRIGFTLQIAFAVGLLVAGVAASFLIPAFGWRSMFVVGTLPVLLAIALPLLAPESPRWLALKGRLDEAEAIVRRIEGQARVPAGTGASPVPASTMPAEQASDGGDGLRRLFAGNLAARTLSTWFFVLCASFAGYGIVNWMPTFYATVYDLPLEMSLRFGMTLGVAGVAGAVLGFFLIDRVGRKPTLLTGYFGTALALITLVAWRDAPVAGVIVLTSLALVFASLPLCGIYVYVTELYPTGIRALGAGLAASWLRIGSIVGPLVVAALLSSLGVTAVFWFFALSALAGGLVVWVFGVETSGKQRPQSGGPAA